MTEKQKQEVKDILLMPIECTTQESKIFRYNDRIFSSQEYEGDPDPDMSDFAIEFYKIVYEVELLKKEGYSKKLLNCDFAGDTINSFNCIANMIPKAGKSKAQRTQKKEWPQFLQEYHGKYHCLANFWILPQYIGRGLGTKLNRYDSVDLLLNELEKNYNKELGKYIDYFKQMKDYPDFCKKHFIENYEPLPTVEVFELYKIRKARVAKTDEKLVEDAEELIERANKFLENRADCISQNDNVCKKLYDKFKSLGILS